MPAAVEIRFALREDLPPLADFIVRANAQPASQSLYCAARTAGEVRAALRNTEDFREGWERFFVVARKGDEVIAAVGCQLDSDGTLGWLWGPWVNQEPEAWTAAPTMLDRLLVALPGSVRRVEAFLHAENRHGLRFLGLQGFQSGPLTHIYLLPRAAWSLSGADGTDCPALRPAHKIAFARLHADTFPARTGTTADDLLAGLDDEHVIFAAVDGLRLLGYVCVSVNHAPKEGFIDYLAVKPTARGRGVGGRLLRAALRWTFEAKRLPQTALCVSEWRDGARRLYEQAGFRLNASGVGMRRYLRGGSAVAKGR